MSGRRLRLFSRGAPRRAALASAKAARLTVPFDFKSLPRQPIPRVVLSPRRILADLLSKGWVESAIPLIAFALVIAGVLATQHEFLAPANLSNLAQYASDGGLVVLGLLIVVAVGGIDLSVGSNFAMSAFAALYGFHILGLPLSPCLR